MKILDPNLRKTSRRLDLRDNGSGRVQVARIEGIGQRDIKRNRVTRYFRYPALGRRGVARANPGLLAAIAHEVVHLHELNPLLRDRPADGDRVADGESGGIGDIKCHSAGRYVRR